MPTLTLGKYSNLYCYVFFFRLLFSIKYDFIFEMHFSHINSTLLPSQATAIKNVFYLCERIRTEWVVNLNSEAKRRKRVRWRKCSRLFAFDEANILFPSHFKAACSHEPNRRFSVFYDLKPSRHQIRDSFIRVAIRF